MMEYTNKKIKKVSGLSSRGFSAIELIIVVSLTVVLFTVVISSFSSFRQKSILNTETQELLTIINRARLLSVSSKNDQQFGVHFESGRVVLFQGITYVPNASLNEVHVLNSTITLSSIVVQGGGADVVFEKVTGATSKNATTTLLVSGTSASSTVLVLLTGVATLR